MTVLATFGTVVPVSVFRVTLFGTAVMPLISRHTVSNCCTCQRFLRHYVWTCFAAMFGIAAPVSAFCVTLFRTAMPVSVFRVIMFESVIVSRNVVYCLEPPCLSAYFASQSLRYACQRILRHYVCNCYAGKRISRQSVTKHCACQRL